MADIFLSYSEQDRARARNLADHLQAAGWSVWWDRRIPAGRTWRSVLAQELETMRCMVVLWSTHSVHSEWVCEEANEGRQLGRLVPVAIEAVRPPAGFREIQAADLVGWDGGPDDAGLRQLLGDIARLIGPPVPATTAAAAGAAPTSAAAGLADAPVAPAPRRAWLWLAGAVLLLGAGGYMAWRPHTPAQPATTPQPQLPEALSAAPAALSAASATPLAAPAVQPAVPASPAVVAARRPPGNAPSNAPTHPAANPRCNALLERAALGETLSDQSLTFLRQECHR